MRVPTPRRRVHSKKRWTDPEEVDNGSSWHSVGPRWPRSWFFFRRKRISSPIATTSWIKDIRCATYVRSIRAFDRCWNLFPDILLVGSWIFYEASNGRENILFLVPVWFLRRMTPSTISIPLAVEFPLFLGVHVVEYFDSRLIHESLLDNFIVHVSSLI